MGIQTHPPQSTWHTTFFYRKWIFVSALVMTYRKGQTNFCLGVPDKNCLHSYDTVLDSSHLLLGHARITVLAQLFHSTFSRVPATAGPGFLEVQTWIRAVGHLQHCSPQEFHIYLHFAYLEKANQGTVIIFLIVCYFQVKIELPFLSVYFIHTPRSSVHSQTHGIQMMLFSGLKYLLTCGPVCLH